jgi:purine-binding chemotaxis protein CheW
MDERSIWTLERRPRLRPGDPRETHSCSALTGAARVGYTRADAMGHGQQWAALLSDRLPADPGATRAVVVFAAGGQRYGLDLDVVDRALAMVAITAVPGAPAGVVGAINVHGEVVPVLAVPGSRAAAEAPSAAQQLLLARTSRRLLALIVDDVQGVLEVPSAAIAPADGAAASGIAALAAGLLVIHDLEAFLSAEQEERLAEALAEAAR